MDSLIDIEAITADAIQIPRYIAIPAVAIPLLFVFLLAMLISYRLRRPTASNEQAKGQVREQALHSNKDKTF